MLLARSLVLALAASAAPLATAQDCAALEPQGDPLVWLAHLQTQEELTAIFDCAPASDPARLPLGRGQGYGSVYNQWPVWNDLQTVIGRLIWGGKRFYADDNGDVRLLNVMHDSGTERYRAAVYVTESIRDARPTVVLDYRIDDSTATLGGPQSAAQFLVDQIALGIRDEIREIHQNGEPTGVYLGRAYLLRAVPPLAPATAAQFVDPASWFFAANFFLDFRS